MTTLTAVPYPATTVAVRSNLAPNASVESSAQGWNAFGAGATGVVARMGPYPIGQHLLPGLEDGRAGTSFVRVTWSSQGASVGGGLYYQGEITVTAGQPYTASAYVRCSTVQRLAIGIDWLTADGSSVVGTSLGPASVVPGSSWVRLSVVNATAPAGAGRARVYMYAQPGSGGSIWGVNSFLDADALLFEQTGELRPYFDGNTSSIALIAQRYQWSGVVNLSPSFLARRTPAAGAVQVTPFMVLEYGATRQAGSELHQVIGRPDPVPVLRPMRTRTGMLELFFLTQAHAASAQTTLYGSGGVVLLRDEDLPAMDMYHVATSTEVVPGGGNGRWILRVQYAEVYGTAGAW